MTEFNTDSELKASPPMSSAVLRHGGDLARAIKTFGGAAEHWLDLSSGISPWAYPLPALDNSLWQKLPEHPTQLLEAASNYYACSRQSLTPTPGSQVAINLIPELLEPRQTVAIPLIGYQEHAKAWHASGHNVLRYQGLAQLQRLSVTNAISSAVVINPNNPTGERIQPEALRSIAHRLPGILLVDEAFADVDNRNSLCRDAALSNIVVLRSFGKFFGLAGCRVGFLIGNHAVRQRVHTILSPWPINAAAQHIAEVAFRDTKWHAQQRAKIANQSQRLNIILTRFIAQTPADLTCDSAGLFTTLSGTNEAIFKLHKKLADQKIWTRIGDAYQDFDNPLTIPESNRELTQTKNWLRVSLPGEKLDRLANTLNTITL